MEYLEVGAFVMNNALCYKLQVNSTPPHLYEGQQLVMEWTGWLLPLHTYLFSTKLVLVLVRCWCWSQCLTGSSLVLPKNRLLFHKQGAESEPRHYVTVYVSYVATFP